MNLKLLEFRLDEHYIEMKIHPLALYNVFSEINSNFSTSYIII